MRACAQAARNASPSLREAFALPHDPAAVWLGSTLKLYADRLVRVGDFCRYGEDPSPGWLRIGNVEAIGLRSTRIRGIERTITTVPDAEFANMHIVNFAKREERLLKTVLWLSYETTPAQTRYVLAKLRELLLGHPMVTPELARVRFAAYGSFSMDVEVFAYLRCREQNEFLAVQEDILLCMGDIVKEAGSGFAFSSQTAYLTRDTGLDAERRGEAGALVESWRARDKLSFPEFEETERGRLEDTLDYPPKGSPSYQPRVGLSTPPAGAQARPPTEPKDTDRELEFDHE